MSEKRLECRLKEVLAERNMTQAMLSELSGIGRGTINSIANNRMKKIPTKAICNICVALKCNVGEIWQA